MAQDWQFGDNQLDPDSLMKKARASIDRFTEKHTANPATQDAASPQGGLDEKVEQNPAGQNHNSQSEYDVKTTQDLLTILYAGRRKLARKLDKFAREAKDSESEEFLIWSFGLYNPVKDIEEKPITDIKRDMIGIMNFYKNKKMISNDVRIYVNGGGISTNEKAYVLLDYLANVLEGEEDIDYLSKEKAESIERSIKDSGVNEQQMRQLFAKVAKHMKIYKLNILREELSKYMDNNPWLKKLDLKERMILSEDHSGDYKYLEAMIIHMPALKIVPGLAKAEYKKFADEIERISEENRIYGEVKIIESTVTSPEKKGLGRYEGKKGWAYERIFAMEREALDSLLGRDRQTIEQSLRASEKELNRLLKNL